MATMTATSAEVLYGGTMVVVTFEGDTPASFGAPDWFPGRSTGKSAWLMVDGVRKQVRYGGHLIGSNVPEVWNAAYDHATKTITKTGAFTNYRSWVTDDRIAVRLVNAGSGDVGNFAAASRVSDDAITLTDTIGASATAVSLYPMDAGQGTKLVWRIGFIVVGTPIVYSASTVTFNAHAGAVADFAGNAIAATTALSVTNNSLMAADGFTAAAAFTRGTGGVTVYVAPGYGSDANSFAQSQNTATPYATVNKALSELFNESKGGTGSAILILQGTNDASTTARQLKISGQDIRHPMLIDSYWDAGAGVGTEGVRPKLSFPLETSGGGGTPSTVDHVVFRGIDLDPNDITVAAVALFRSNSFVFDDCVFQRCGTGLSLNVFDPSVGSAYGDRFTLNKCLFKDTWTTSGNSHGIYSTYTKRFEIIDCHFDFTGRKNSNGYGSDALSRSIYNDCENDGCWIVRPYISRSDHIQNRAGGCIVDAVATESHLLYYHGGLGGRLARCYNELGAGFGTDTFTGATYTHSSRTIAATGIGSGMSSVSSVYVSSGTGATVGQYRLASATADAIVLTGDGLGAGADGSTNIAGVKQTAPRGLGPHVQQDDDIRQPMPQSVEQILLNRTEQYGGNATFANVPQKSLTFKQLRHAIMRNILAYEAREAIIAGTDSRPPPERLDFNQNVLTTSLSVRGVIKDDPITSFAFFHADNNIYLTASAAHQLFQNYVTLMSLATWRTTTGQEANSIASATLGFTDSSADLGDWAGECGLTATAAALRTAVRARAMATWPSWADMGNAFTFLAEQYEIISGVSAVGTAPLDYYGVGDGTDPAEYSLPPLPPTDVVVLHSFYTEALINWTLSATSGITRYRVYAGTTAGSLSLVDDSDDVGTEIFIDSGDGVGYWIPTGLTPGATYYFEVRAVSDDGVESDPTTEEDFTLLQVETGTGDRIYITAASAVETGTDVTNEANAEGAPNGTVATITKTGGDSAYLGGAFEPADYTGQTIIAWKVGAKLDQSALHGAAYVRFLLTHSGGASAGQAVSTVRPTGTLTEFESYIAFDPIEGQSVANFTAMVENGDFDGTIGIGAPNGASVQIHTPGGTTTVGVDAIWLQPVLAGESGGASAATRVVELLLEIP